MYEVLYIAFNIIVPNLAQIYLTQQNSKSMQESFTHVPK